MFEQSQPAKSKPTSTLTGPRRIQKTIPQASRNTKSTAPTRKPSVTGPQFVSVANTTSLATMIRNTESLCKRLGSPPPTLENNSPFAVVSAKGHPDPDICFAEGRFYLATPAKDGLHQPGTMGRNRGDSSRSGTQTTIARSTNGPIGRRSRKPTTTHPAFRSRSTSPRHHSTCLLCQRDLDFSSRSNSPIQQKTTPSQSSKRSSWSLTSNGLSNITNDRSPGNRQKNPAMMKPIQCVILSLLIGGMGLLPGKEADDGFVFHF